VRAKLPDGENTGYLFQETMLADVVQIDGQHYILVSGTQNSGITMFRVDDNGQMEWVESVTDTATTSFNRFANYAFTTTDDGSVVMVTAGSSENSITVFDLGYEEPPIDMGAPVLPDVA
jgi:6-phosphogluconolactonase (cycloisomerase 2 family)